MSRQMFALVTTVAAALLTFDAGEAEAACGTFGRYKTTVTQQTTCTGIPFCSSTGINYTSCGGEPCGYSVSSNTLVVRATFVTA